MNEIDKVTIIELTPVDALKPKRSLPKIAMATTLGTLALCFTLVKLRTSEEGLTMPMIEAPTDPYIDNNSTVDTSIFQVTTGSIIDGTDAVSVISTETVGGDPNYLDPIGLVGSGDFGGSVPVDTTIPDTTTSILDTTTTTTPETTIPAYKPQDIYLDICEPSGWVNCAEYKIYNEFGEQVNQAIANSDWSTSYIAELGGGGANGSAIKVRDIYPCAPDECVSYTR